MPLLFSYGTLQKDDVQQSTVGRHLHGQPDELPAYEKALVTIGSAHHLNVRFNGNQESRVAGTVFEVTDVDLVRVDAYEAAFLYKRVTALLASNRQAWVYLKSD